VTRNRTYLSIFFISIFFACGKQSEQEKPINFSSFAPSIRIADTDVNTTLPDDETLPPEIDTIYAACGNHLLWFNTKGEAISYAFKLLEACRKAAKESWVFPTIFEKLIKGGGKLLKQRTTKQITEENLWNLDTKLSRLAYALVRFEALGQLNPYQWDIKRDTPDISAWLIRQFKQQTFESFSSLNPDILGFATLQQALNYYERIGKRVDFKPIYIDAKIEPGTKDSKIRKIRYRLSVLLQDGAKLLLAPEPALYDEHMVDAIKYFQSARGLKSDGTIGFRTMRFINLPPDSVKLQICKNLERLKWMPSSFPDGDFIQVNLPDFKVRVMHGIQEIMRMNCIVGRYKNQTPVFSDSMEYLVMSPFWNVPKSIAIKEIWAHVTNDPDYLENHYMQVFVDGENVSGDTVDWSTFKKKDFEYRIKIRQKPGAYNSLGRIKFIFPNEHWVYLHDTNAKYLFGKEERSLSHGCIRIEKPIDLAMYLLRDNREWESDTAKLLEAMDTTVPQIVHLKQKVPIFLYYLTAWGENGLLQLRRDPYLLDIKMDSLLNDLKVLNKSDDLLVASEEMNR